MREAFSGYWKQTSGVLVIALVLRIFFAFYCPHIDDGDSPIYEAFARNLLKFGVYSHYQAQDHAAPEPTLIRAPGYPLMLAAVFAVAGEQNETAVRVSQAFLDTVTCLLIALIAFEISVGDNRRRRRIAQCALLLSALCPFIANYAATILTEVPATLLWTAGTLFGLRALKHPSAKRNWFYCGLLAGAATLFRPESGILVGILGLVLCVKQIVQRVWKPILTGTVLLAAGLLLALLPWTVRNAVTLRTFQMLAPTYAQDSDERVTSGYFDWCRTWLWTYQDIAAYLWPLESEDLPTGTLPTGSFDTAAQRDTILTLIKRHNNEGDTLDAASDSTFALIAGERRRRHPFRFYISLPALRSLAMWFTPRVEILSLEGRLLPIAESWENDPVEFSITLFMFLVNAAFVGLGLSGVVSMLRGNRSFEGFASLGCFTLVAIIVLRTAFLAYFAFPEPRYILEAYPCVIVLAAFGIGISARQHVS
jgi:4-amino-4-deoxy-L-arabinose transferase-like glycosyltransferase